MQLPVFVINLPGSQQRLSEITAALGRQGIAFERIDAVDGRGIPLRQFADYDAALGRRLYGRPLSGPEMGCFLSHRAAAAMVVKSGANYALVLEDDAAPPEGLLELCTALTSWLDAKMAGNWDLVNLSRAPKEQQTPLSEITYPGGRCNLVVAHDFPLTTTALLWSAAGARAFVENSGRIYAPVDQYLRDVHVSSNRGLGCNPAPFSTTRAPSDIRYKLSQRMRDTPWLRYAIVKNLRLMRNARAARQAIQAYQAQARQDSAPHVD
jgi:glycosyl transferase family 25